MTDNEKRAHDLALLYLSKHVDGANLDLNMPSRSHQDSFINVYAEVYRFFMDQILDDPWVNPR